MNKLPFIKGNSMQKSYTNIKIASLVENIVRDVVDENLGVKLFNEEKLLSSKSNNLICCPNRDRIKNSNNKWKVFLAGPIQGAPSWQHSIDSIENVIFYSPRRYSYNNFNYSEQVLWERDYMNYSDVILFWIPEEEEHVEGRSYAQTTRTEFGEYLALGKKIIFGCYDDFPGKRYFASKLKEYGVNSKIHSSLGDCINELKSYIKECEENVRTWFISDTHFSDPRAWELSRRPFKDVDEMDKVMIRNWNDNIKPCDNVYHLGDFAKEPDKVLPWLNGNITLIYGNYERDGKYKVNDSLFRKTYKESVILKINGRKYGLCHEPLRGKALMSRHPDLYGIIFGHIHGRSKVKGFNGVDVGVDGWFYKPMSIDDCNFFINAVHKGYYDKEVWC